MVDAADLKSAGGNPVQVRVLLPALGLRRALQAGRRNFRRSQGARCMRPNRGRWELIAGAIVAGLGTCGAIVGLLTSDYSVAAHRLGFAGQWLRSHAWLPTLQLHSFPDERLMWTQLLTFYILLVAIVWFEIHQKLIPDAITIPGLVIGLAMNAMLGWHQLLWAVAGAACGFAYPFTVAHFVARSSGGEPLGGGAIKMGAMIGAFCGMWSVPVIAFGAAIALVHVIWRNRGRRWEEYRRQKTEFGPYLALAAGLGGLVPIGLKLIALASPSSR